MDIDLLSLYFVVLYAVFMFFIVFRKRSFNETNASYVNKFTVVIPAKDEAENIGNCLQALLNQDFDQTRFEILVMNDSSVDQTVAICNSFTKLHTHIRVCDVVETNDLVGKANAIDQAISLAQNELIVICDADCQPNRQWLSAIDKQFLAEIDVVSGFTLLAEKKRSIFGVLQNIDWIFLLGMGASAARFGRPISCIGSNLAFRKSLYVSVGGYKALGFSITEDLALYKRFAKDVPKAFSFAIVPESINWSKPMPTFKEFYKQRKRWVLGSFDLNLFGGVLLGLALLAHAMPLYSIFSGQHVLPFIGLLLTDAIILSYFFSLLKQRNLILFLPIYFVFYFASLAAIPIVLCFARQVEWKGRVYNRKGVVH